MVRGFSPLDDELGLLPGSLSPGLMESVVRLGTHIPFEPAAEMLAHFTKVQVGKETVRRITERAGKGYVEVQRAELEGLEREMPTGSEGPPLQQLSVDGAMVPLVHKEWAEVKTLAIGTVQQVMKDGELAPHTYDISYFSRLADHMTFARLATVETHRRGTARAGEVAGVVDGAEWEQVFIDLHRVDAVRILDWPHAAEYLSRAAHAVFGVGTAQSQQWLKVQLHELKHGDPEKVLSKLRGLRDDLLLQGSAKIEVMEVVSTSLEYLEKRREQIRYAEFIAAGYPIGSGIVESANKLVVQARLKGAGMHWERRNVDPMVALRNVACSDRWEEAWPLIAEQLALEPKRRSAERRAQRKAAKAIAEKVTVAIPPVVAEQVEKPVESTLGSDVPPEVVQASDKPLTRSLRPSDNHPWRRIPIGRARRKAA